MSYVIPMIISMKTLTEDVQKKIRNESKHVTTKKSTKHKRGQQERRGTE